MGPLSILLLIVLIVLIVGAVYDAGRLAAVIVGAALAAIVLAFMLLR